MAKRKIAKCDTTILVEPSDKWVCVCGEEHGIGAYAAAHWHLELYHTCKCGITRILHNGKLTTQEKTQ